MINMYKLIGRCAVPCSLEEFGAFMKDHAARRVDRTVIGEIVVSTVFLGLDHGFEEDGAPMLFETMIFGNNDDDTYQTRCETWEQAEKMHAAAVREANEWHETGKLDLDQLLAANKTLPASPRPGKG